MTSRQVAPPARQDRAVESAIGRSRDHRLLVRRSSVIRRIVAISRPTSAWPPLHGAARRRTRCHRGAGSPAP